MLTDDSLTKLRLYVEHMRVQCDQHGYLYRDGRACTSVQELSDLLELAEAVVNYKEAIENGAEFLEDSPEEAEADAGCGLRVLSVHANELIDLEEENGT